MRIGADIGGTFTDLVLAGEDGRVLQIDKILTTPERPDDAVVEGVSRLLSAAGLAGGDVSHLVHGTTLFTNALIERKGARTALVTTRGFRDAIEIGREHRYDMYDLHLRRPTPLAPRRLRFEVSERVLVDGSVRMPLDHGDVERVIELLRAAGVEAVAVSLLHSYANDAHEQEIGAALRAILPDMAVTLSSEVAPEIREFERTSTTLANAYVQNIARHYLMRLCRRLEEACGITGALYVMQSNGGVCEVEEAVRFPIRLVESGPAAGAMATVRFGEKLGCRDLISFDMGGTTAKACVIADGNLPLASEFEVAREYVFKKGSGMPVRVPSVEMIEIGTGGGSIAWVDAIGRLQVGPQSAGASPGPACYGQGGTLPTVTDADLVLGYLDPDFFLGGSMVLDMEAARSAIKQHIAAPLGLRTIQAAWAIHRVANESMAAAARIHAVERGREASRASVFAFGGAGPVHAFGVASVLGAPEVVYPVAAGVMSAIGLLAAPLALNPVHSRLEPLDELDWPAAAALVGAMEARGRSSLGRAVADADIEVRYSADMRYRKQGYEVNTPIPAGALSASRADEFRAAFEKAYIEIYGQSMSRAPVEIVSWRLVVQGPRPVLVAPDAGAGTEIVAGVEPPVKGRRPVYVPSREGLAVLPVYDRRKLGPGSALKGPAIVEEEESTVVINESARIEVDMMGNLRVEVLGR